MTGDIHARLAAGAEAVAGQSGPVHDWYYAEDGARLDALATDGAALASAAVASEEALRLQRDALDVLTASWNSGSGSGAVDFLTRHCGASTDVVAALSDGAAILTALGVNLERAVNAKVDAVLTGEWSQATRSPAESAVAYTEAVTRLGELPSPRFETPLLPRADGYPTTDAVPAAPAGPPSVQPPMSSFAPGVPTWTLPDFGGSLAGLISQIAGVLGSYSDALPPPAVEPHTPEAPPDPVAEIKPVVSEQRPSADEPASVVEPPTVADSPRAAGSAPTDAPPVADTPAPLAAEAPDSPAATDHTPTPCEIAADELPQVGW